MITGIILAAGESKRMRESRGVDTPKQLLPWQNTIMLQHVIDNVTVSQLNKILVVLGYNADEIASQLKISSSVRILFNPDFKVGMSSSLKLGIRNISSDTMAFMVLLGDQPLIDSDIINKLIDSYRLSQHGIVIPVHLGHRGHPIIFDRQYRDELLSISDQIAREVIKAHSEDVFEVNVDSSKIFVDIDTFQDYTAVKAQIEPA
ncbi:MAG: molybdenum cofactor cytidylyltransferase [Thermoproteota archaeon]|nr:molybdenum cofactor cytidylyltransferase [Thermoproteota archaeon]